MYRKHFALTQFPFDSQLQPENLFASSTLSEAEVRLKHLLELRAIGLVTGDGVMDELPYTLFQGLRDELPGAAFSDARALAAASCCRCDSYSATRSPSRCQSA